MNTGATRSVVGPPARPLASAMRRFIVRALTIGACCLLLAACARRGATIEPAPELPPSPPGAPSDPPPSGLPLPPVPMVDGPLALRVIYPPANALIASRDSNFILGSVGTGRATLEINGHPVQVHPNGAFLAFLPIPAADAPRYEIRAVAGTDTARATHPVRLLAPLPVLTDSTRLVVDSSSVQPAGTMRLRPRDMVRVAVRAPTNATVSIAWEGGSQQLLAGDPTGTGTADPALNALSAVARDRSRFATDVPASLLSRSRGTIIVARGADTVRLPVGTIEVDTTATPQVVMLGAQAAVNDALRRVAMVDFILPASGVGNPDLPIVGRSIPEAAGTSRWFLLPGTIVEMTGRVGNYTRIRLDALLEVWVENAQVTALPVGTPLPRPSLLSARIAPSADWVDLVLPIGERIPFIVEPADRALVLTLYGARASVDVIAYAGNDSLIRTIDASQVTSDRAQLTIRLDAQPFGYETRWDEGRLILRIRRPPRVDSRSPLRGLIIALDPGHPPIGSTGPTGLYEGDAVLEIGLRAKPMLEALGATVVMTRSTKDTVPLAARPIIARNANAHAFVSIHLNAYPDGVNPFVANGTGTYFYHPHSERLARAVQRGMLDRMGLRNVGVFQQSFAVIRNSWMPAVLAEGAFVIIPEQEAALRTPEFQDAYARGVVDGLVEFFRGLQAK